MVTDIVGLGVDPNVVTSKIMNSYGMRASNFFNDRDRLKHVVMIFERSLDNQKKDSDTASVDQADSSDSDSDSEDHHHRIHVSVTDPASKLPRTKFIKKYCSKFGVVRDAYLLSPTCAVVVMLSVRRLRTIVLFVMHQLLSLFVILCACVGNSCAKSASWKMARHSRR